MRRAMLGAVLATLVGAGAAGALEGLQPGMPVPPVTFERLDGGRAAVGDHREARAILVVFWATWSSASAEVLERAERLHARHRDQGLVVLGVNVEGPAASADLAPVRAMAARLKLTFPLLVDRGLVGFGAYGVMAVPTSVLVGGDGVMRAALASYPIAEREAFFDLVEATVLGRPVASRPAAAGPRPDPRAVRYFNLGRTMAARGQVDQAVMSLRKAMEIDGAFPLPGVALAQLQRERAEAREVIATEGGTTPTLRLTPGERAGLLREAERLLGEAVQRDPNDAVALTELALVHLARGDHSRARAELERAITADPAHAPARAHLGAFRLDTGDVDLGRRDLAAAIQLNPLDWRLHVTAAQAYERRGWLGEAVAEYRRGVELLWETRRGQGLSPREAGAP